jgi:multiple sugar transport system permease protein/sn-glycerol 3-phosphate transport system permease protein
MAEVALPSRAQVGSLSRYRQREYLLFIAFIAPNLFFLSVFVYWPMLYNFYLSMIDWDFLRPTRTWVGFGNYVRVFSDPQFWTIFGNTLVFAISSVALTLIMGLGLAMLLNLPLRGRNGVRALIFAPYMLSGAAIAAIWIFMFDPRVGVFATMLGWINIPSPNWLLDSNWAMFSVILVYVWKNAGYAAVIYLAGLQGISRDQYDAAKVDGANALDTFLNITLPGLGPVSFFLLVTTVLGAFRTFDIILVLTNGGPVDATSTLVFHLYENGFVTFDAGRAGVTAVVLFLLMLVVTIVQIRYVERRVTYA